MEMLGIFITVLSLANVYGKAFHTPQMWRVPCNGATITREVICGGGTYPGPIPNPNDLTPGSDLPPPPAQSAPRSPRGHNSSNIDKNSTLPGTTFSAEGRTITRQLGDTVCEVGGYIAAAGLEDSLCEETCDKKFDIFQNYLIVYPPCKGLFLVTMCKSEW